MSALHFHNFSPLVGSGPEIIAACGMCAFGLFANFSRMLIFVCRCTLWNECVPHCLCWTLQAVEAQFGLAMALFGYAYFHSSSLSIK